MKEKSILLINYDKRWGGGQEYLFILVQGLLQNSCRIGQLVAPSSPSEERFAKAFAHNPNYIKLAVKRNSLLNLWKIINFARNYKIVHIHREHDLWLGALLKLFIPKIKLVFSQHIKPTKKRNLLFLFNEIICNSSYSQALFKNLYKKESHIIYPSISIPNCLSEPSIKLSGNPVLLMSAAFHKNQPEMLSIFEKVIAQLPEARLYFMGPSQEQSAVLGLEKEIKTKKLEQVVTILAPQKRESYLSILKQADIIVSSYYEEAFGLAILEAALMSKAIVAYESGGIVEILQGYPKAFLVKKGNQEKFVDLVISCFADGDYKKSVSLTTLQERFSEKQLVEKHLKIYASLE